MPTLRIQLEERDQAFITELVSSGRYANATEVVQAALELLMRRERKAEALRAALIAGEQSDTPTDN